MKFVNPLAALILCIFTGTNSVSHAQDTDLFMTTSPASTALPNVLMILDNTANWSSSTDGGSKFEMEQIALASIVSGLDVNEFNIGLMMFSETGSGNGNPSGGYVRSAIREMTADNKAHLVTLINNLTQNGDKGNGAEYALAMHEAYLYFQGLEARAGHNKVKHDPEAFSPIPRKYKSPRSNACAKNYIIFISNGAPDNGENTDAASLLDSLNGKLAGDPISLNPSGRQANWADEYARFMASKDILTYTIDVNPADNGQGPDNTELLKSMGGQGKRYYEVRTGEDFEFAFNDAFDEIQAVNSVFAATALPVSVNVRGTFLNEVYMAVFRPDASANPRWLGNLKVFQLVVDQSTNSLFLADANGNDAQSTTTGFINNSAVSFWTDTSDYWAHAPSGTPPSASDSPDGEIVEKGGSAQEQRSDWPTRNLYTCTTGCSAGDLLSGTAFNTTNASITAADLGVADADRSALIDWVRGEDNFTTPERTAGEVRPSLHGDVVHSRPAVVNYNRTGNDDDIVVFYGANDGVFRAIRGGKAVVEGGSELWGFVAPEFFGQLNRLREDSPAINVPSLATIDDPDLNKPYFADGVVSIYTHDANSDGRINADDGDLAYIYATMRRGGRFIYAFDVTTPETPSLLWKRSSNDTDYSELAQSWSEAKVATINLNGTATPVVIMGAGYDPAAEDQHPAGTVSMGRGVFVINAVNGEVIWQAGTADGLAHSVAADVTVIDRNRNGYADRLYAADTGGNIWRIDIGDADTDNWAINKLASLGGSGADARKFLFPADVVYSRDANGPYDAVLIGSGDREKPFDEDVTHHFYMIKDRHVYTTGTGQATIPLSELYNASANLVQDGTEAEQTTAQTSLLEDKGWYFTLDSGEKVVGGAVAIGGTLFFSTNQPDDSSCSNLGVARVYAIDYRDASATINFDAIGDLTITDRSTTVPGGGYLPSPTPVVTEIDGKKYQTVCFGPTCVQPPDVVFEARRRVFWHKSID